MTLVTNFNTLYINGLEFNFDSLTTIADFLPIPAHFGTINKSLNTWWMHYIASRAPLLSKFVQNLLQSSFSINETTTCLARFPNTTTTIFFNLHVAHNTVCLDKLNYVAKKFPNVTSLYYQRPMGIESQNKELSGALAGSKFVTNALCNIGRALPCIKTLGKKIQKTAEEKILDCTKDTVLEKISTLFPKIVELHIHVISVEHCFRSIQTRAITSLPAFPELEKISISPNNTPQYSSLSGILDLSSLIPESYTIFSQYQKLQSLDIKNCLVSYDKNTYDLFQDKTIQKSFLHLPENITSLDIKLNASKLPFILSRCKKLTSLSLNCNSYDNMLFPNAPYTTLTHLKVSGFSGLYSRLESVFRSFPKLTTLNIDELDTFRHMGGGIISIPFQHFAPSNSLEELHLNFRNTVSFTNFTCKEKFPNLKTLALSCLEGEPDEIPGDLEIVQLTTHYDIDFLNNGPQRYNSYVFRVT